MQNAVRRFGRVINTKLAKLFELGFSETWKVEKGDHEIDENYDEVEHDHAYDGVMKLRDMEEMPQMGTKVVDLIYNTSAKLLAISRLEITSSSHEWGCLSSWR